MTENEIHLGDLELDDEAVIAKLESLKRSIKTWATRRQLWQDAWFQVPYIIRSECPRRGDILYLTFEGPLYNVFSGAADDDCEQQFREILDTHGFEYELEDHITATIFPSDEDSWDDYLAVYRWQWLKERSKQRLIDLHSEVFEFVSSRPGSLRNLSWREYEEFLDAVFRNQGFHTELGPGSNDGGVDIRLYRNEVTPELVTLVQAKRYRTRPIGLEPVAALLGIASEQRALDAIFVTTSRFQPKARRFAKTTQQRVDLPSIQLVDSQRVAEWCHDISESLRKFYRGDQLEFLPSALSAEPTELTGKVVVAHTHFYGNRNYFCVVDADFPQESILRYIQSTVVSDDGYGQRGREIADVESDHDGQRFVASKSIDENGRVSFWGDRHLFFVWDGTPQYFDHCD
ncbi:MAG: restriction endonuclease [Planctomycetota bacterium]